MPSLAEQSQAIATGAAIKAIAAIPTFNKRVIFDSLGKMVSRFSNGYDTYQIFVTKVTKIQTDRTFEYRVESMRTDEEIMKEYQNGSYPAFQELYRRYSGRVYGYLLKRLKEPQKTADVFQQVFMKMHQSKNLYSAEFHFAPWLFTVAHRVLLDYLKSSQTRIENAAEFFDENQHIQSKEIQSGSTMNQLEQGLHQLPKEQQDLIQMRYFDELPFSEISKRLDQTEVNVRKRLSRAIQNLRKTFLKGRIG